MKSLKILLPILFISTFLFSCEKKEERVARWNVNIRSTPDAKAKKLTWLSKAEKVNVIKEEGGFTHISLAGGKSGYVESKALAIQAIVLTSDDIELLRRPSESSGKSSSAKRIKKGAVVFVIETSKSKDVKWLKITGGSSKHPLYQYVEGWIKEGYGYDNSGSLVRNGIELETAILKKDLDALKKLASKPEPISEMAASQIVEIEGINEAPLEEEIEVAPQTNTQPQDTP